MADDDELIERARAYVRGLEPECTWTDGYTCAEVVEDRFLDREAASRMVPGNRLRAWDVCYRDFLGTKDLSAEQKDLRHYRIGFSEDEHDFIVVFSGLLLPHIDEHGRPDGVINAVFGRSVTYRVDKATLTVRERRFLR